MRFQDECRVCNRGAERHSTPEYIRWHSAPEFAVQAMQDCLTKGQHQIHSDLSQIALGDCFQ
jgi:hypothetical protein